jgi:N-formylglutamate deformylase
VASPARDPSPCRCRPPRCHELSLHPGRTPLLISLPHVGTGIPEDLRHRACRARSTVEDTDWHLDRLYAFAADLGASLLVPR